MAKYEIHISDVKSFKQCRYYWDFSSPMRRNLAPDYPLPYFFLGHGIHTALDYYYGHGLDPVETFEAWYVWRMGLIREAALEAFGAVSGEKEEMLQEQYDLGKGLLEHYLITFPASQEPFIVLSTEQEFHAPIRTPSGRSSPRFYAAGRFDGVIYFEDDGTYWLLEHKSYASLSNLRSLEIDSQAAMYIYGAEHALNVPISGVYYNLLRKKVPTRPLNLKRGGLSKNKQIDTTFETYLHAIREEGLDPQDYVDMLGILQERGNTFFKRLRVRRSRHEVGVFQRNLYYTAREMCNPKVRIYPSDHWLECNRCSFREPCLMRLAGQPFESLLGVAFVHRKPREQFSFERGDEAEVVR